MKYHQILGAAITLVLGLASCAGPIASAPDVAVEASSRAVSSASFRAHTLADRRVFGGTSTQNPTDVINIRFQSPIGTDALATLRSILKANSWLEEGVSVIQGSGVSPARANVDGSWGIQVTNFCMGQHASASNQDNGWYDTTPGRRNHIRVYTTYNKPDTIYLAASTEYWANGTVHQIYSFNGGRNWFMRLIAGTMDPTLASMRNDPTLYSPISTGTGDWDASLVQVRVATSSVKTPRTRANQNNNYLTYNSPYLLAGTWGASYF